MAYPQTASSGSVNYQSATMAPTPISPMQEARQNLTSSVSLLDERLGELERRIEGILRPSNPRPVEGQPGSKIETVPSEHRQFLASTSAEIHNLVGRIDAMLGRIEL